MEEESMAAQVRFQRLLDKTMELMEQILSDEIQDYKNMGTEEQEDAQARADPVFRKVDTKALKEFVAGLRELKGLLGEQAGADTALRVVFEAGEEAFNE